MSERDEMEERSEDRRLAERAKALFDESVRELDGETLSRLNRGRQRALDAAGSGGAGMPLRRWLPAAAVTAAAAAVVIVWEPGTGVTELPPETASDVEILLAGEELEMLEDLEFYRWMALNETAGEPGDEVG